MALNGTFMKDPYRDSLPKGTARPVIDDMANKENTSTGTSSEFTASSTVIKGNPYGSGSSSK